MLFIYGKMLSWTQMTAISDFYSVIMLGNIKGRIHCHVVYVRGSSKFYLTVGAW